MQTACANPRVNDPTLSTNRHKVDMYLGSRKAEKDSVSMDEDKTNQFSTFEVWRRRDEPLLLVVQR